MFSTFGPSIYRPMTLRDKMIVGEPSSFINVCQIVTTLTPRRKGGGGESSGDKCVLHYHLFIFILYYLCFFDFFIMIIIQLQDILKYSILNYFIVLLHCIGFSNSSK